MKIEKREFEGNILVTISDHEVRLWVCDKMGSNIFRFKATGRVFRTEQDVTVLPFSQKKPRGSNHEGL